MQANYFLLIWYCFAEVITHTKAFSNYPIQNSLRHNIHSWSSCGGEKSTTKERLRHELYLLAAPKRKDNRRYVAKPKDDEDEVDDDYFQELAEDVKELLRSAKSSATPSPIIPIGSMTDGAILSNVDGTRVRIDDILHNDDEDSPDYVQTFGVDSDEEFVMSPDDIIYNSEEEELVNGAPTNEWREEVSVIIHDVIRKQGLHVQKIFWGGNRVEVVISESEDLLNPVGPSVSALQICHRSMYEEFELREEELAVVSKFEIVVASPGIGEILRTEQDFISFKGFMVTVMTSEIFRKKTKFEGTLVERSVDNVCVSLKGRPINIPRDIITSVRLPKPKYEVTDTEMRKLR